MVDRVTISVPAAEAPVTRDEVKSFLRITGTNDDAEIDLLIPAAVKDAQERYTWRQFVTATLKLTLDAFPAEVIELPRPPLQSVTSVKYYDPGGVLQTLDAARYDVDTASEPGRVKPSYGNAWPATREQMNAVEILYVAGYGAASAVPDGIKTALMTLIGWRFENRELTEDHLHSLFETFSVGAFV